MKKFCFEFNRVETQQVPIASLINGERPADHINRFNFGVLTVLSDNIIVLHSFAQYAVQLHMIHINHQFIHSIFEFMLKENLDKMTSMSMHLRSCTDKSTSRCSFNTNCA